MAKSALGKGLSALINTRPPTVRLEAEPGEKVRQVSVAGIVPSPFQPRKEFARETLNELVESIRQHGIIQPLVVREVGGLLELIAGERRWRAAQEAGLAQVPVITRAATDLEVLELSLIENLHIHGSRKNLECGRKTSRRKSAGAGRPWPIRCGFSICIHKSRRG